MSNWAIASFCFFVIIGSLFVVITTICAIGGFFDLTHMLKELKTSVLDEMDDGRVTHH